MGRQAWISVLGLYNYDSTLFDGMYTPMGMDKQLLVDNILLECAELEILLPDPNVLKQAISFWSRSQARVWDKLMASTQFVYNPIWNKEGIIKEKETRDLTETHDLTDTRNNTETRNLAGTLDATDTDKRSAYNATTFQNQEQHILDHDSTDTGTVSNAGTAKDTGTLKDSGTINRERVEQGNIGITTTQQMIKEEREVSEFNMYDYIVRSFKERFCIMVY